MSVLETAGVQTEPEGNDAMWAGYFDLSLAYDGKPNIPFPTARTTAAEAVKTVQPMDGEAAKSQEVAMQEFEDMMAAYADAVAEQASVTNSTAALVITAATGGGVHF